MDTRSNRDDARSADQPESAQPFAFNFAAGRLCIDFANTGGEAAGQAFEDLHSAADVQRWFAECPLFVPDLSVTEEDLPPLRALRDAIWQMARQTIDTATFDLDDLTLVNQVAASEPLVPRLPGPGEPLGWVAGQACRAALATVARDALDLFSSILVERLRECDSPSCILFFVDRSRPGKRRWCAMEGCGNRAKTRGYRQRVREREHTQVDRQGQGQS